MSLTRRTSVSLAILCVLTAAAFWPVVHSGFLNWDDGVNFVDNFNYRGLGWEQLKWMWTTFHMGHYQPLSWMTLGLDYLLWGMDPRGYHLTNLLLHMANAVLFYFVARRLLGGDDASSPYALLAALLFAVHPLRVESVAWITERRDVLSGAFYLACVLLYLRACDRAGKSSPRFGASLACYLLSLLSKAIGMTLPIVLLLLDVYPLARLPADPRRWTDAKAKKIFLEKIPFAALSAIFAAVAFLAQKHTGVISYFASLGIMPRIQLAVFGAAFYLWKTAVPIHLLPLYTLPPDFHFNDWSFLLSAGLVCSVCAIAIALRRRLPALAAAWVYYLVTLLPVLGLVLSGIYSAADRYTYLSCFPWAILAGAAVRSAFIRLNNPAKYMIGLLLSGIIVGLGALTHLQARRWHDSETLWRYTLSIDPQCAPAHNNLGTVLARSGQDISAAAEFQRAIKIDPQYAEAHNNLGTAFVHQGKLSEAAAEYRQALETDRTYAMARNNLGAVLAGEGKLDEAISEYRKALSFNSEDAHAHNNLGMALAARGQTAEAAAEFQKALSISPHYAQAAENLRSVLNPVSSHR